MSRGQEPAGFWKIFAAAALGVFLVGGLYLLISFMTLGYLFTGMEAEFQSLFSQEKEYKLKDNSVLHLKLDQNIQERSYSNFNKMGFSLDAYLGLHDMIESIHDAKRDPKIEGIFLDVTRAGMGLGSLYELRTALINFKSSGKFVYAFGKNYTQKSYYLASVSDKVFLYPTGHLEFKGLSSTVSFYKDFLDKVNLEIQVIRGSNNKFKSFVEPFIANEMSEANRLQTQKFLDGLWTQMIGDISDSRNISIDSLQGIADSLRIRNGKDAVEFGLVDELMYPADFDALLVEDSDQDQISRPRLVSIKQYRRRKDGYSKRAIRDLFPNIAVVYANGSIHGGKSDPSSIGDETLVKAIRQAANDPFIKAIVLRVNSPGGDALASDLIWDALSEAKKIKPVVVSMGNTAASGGYYISCMADKIFANPTTITGSIGVFLIIPHTGKFFENDLGIHYSRVKTAEHADMSYLDMNLNSFSRALTEEEKKIFQEGVDDTYHDFLSRVNEGRASFPSIDDVDSIGQGRVWSGVDALEIGLVDTLGSLQDAIDYTAELVNLDKVVIGDYPKIKTDGLQELLDLMQGESVNLEAQQEDVLPEFLNNHVEQLKELDDLGTIKASLLWRFDIH